VVVPRGEDNVLSPVEEISARHYDARLPYHNFDHALEVLERARVLLDSLEAAAIPVDRQVVRLAVLFHDAGYADDHRHLGHDSKEAYSATLAREAMRRHGAPEDQILAVINAILCTSRDGRCQTIEENVVRAADLGGLGGEYEVFHRGSINLWREGAYLTGRETPWPIWVEASIPQIRAFARPTLALPVPGFSGGRTYPEFLAQVEANIARLLGEIAA
jgi:predicted metal-dependent HD superfamily phosphohydrolase